MNKVKDPSESDAMGQPTQQSMEPRRLSSELLALDPSQPFHGHSFKENYEESPETADEEVLVETNYGDGTRVPTFSLVRPGIDRADVADLLEKEMPHVTGSWFLKAGEQKVLSFRSLKLVITHDSKNTMIFTADLIVNILNLLLKNCAALDQIPELSSRGNLNLVLHDDGQAERVPDVPFKWQLLRRTDEDRREEAAAGGGGTQGSP